MGRASVLYVQSVVKTNDVFSDPIVDLAHENFRRVLVQSEQIRHDMMSA
jgi:hypothetical protein